MACAFNTGILSGPARRRELSDDSRIETVAGDGELFKAGHDAQVPDGFF